MNAFILVLFSKLVIQMTGYLCFIYNFQTKEYGFENFETSLRLKSHIGGHATRHDKPKLVATVFEHTSNLEIKNKKVT